MTGTTPSSRMQIAAKRIFFMFEPHHKGSKILPQIEMEWSGLMAAPLFSFFLPKTDNGTLKKSSVGCVFADAHAVERTVDEKERHDKESRRKNVGQSCALL